MMGRGGRIGIGNESGSNGGGVGVDRGGEAENSRTGGIYGRSEDSVTVGRSWASLLVY